PIVQELDIRAEKGAYFLHQELSLDDKASKEWLIIANVNQGPAAIANLNEQLKKSNKLRDEVQADIDRGTQDLINLAAASDALQCTRDGLRTARHFSNVLFNIMRGGIFDNNYDISKSDFDSYLQKANRKVWTAHHEVVTELPQMFTLKRLRELSVAHKDPDFKRLCIEYMPLKFSRRHGDPSRPWNKFSINTQSEKDGSKILDYEGNWRDIFQNWEALAHSYPEFIDSMIHKFLNASTFDGYNPYRVTKGGIDWEVVEPDDPWSYIGYWGDHQIIYLLKFLEIIQNYYPSRLTEYFNQEIFVYANVPYRIKKYEELLEDPKNTIDFNQDLEHKISNRREELGADGALLTDKSTGIYRVNFIEKILATVLAKCSNFIPEAGIWLNTQRPEWNDANNALVGNGVSMVTLYYLRRFLVFFKDMMPTATKDEYNVSSEMVDFFDALKDAFESHTTLLESSISNKDRKRILDALGAAGSTYREQIYTDGFSGEKKAISSEDLLGFCNAVLAFMEHSIDANKREDGMYHAYNIASFNDPDEVAISYLNEMLEGQVAVLSSGYLSPQESLELLDNLKESALFRDDQYSYLLYPDKDLPRFLLKNMVSAEEAERIPLLMQLLKEGDTSIIEKDDAGQYHFNGSFNNADSLSAALALLPENQYGSLLEGDRQRILDLFEAVFDHTSFTGRSGTFFGYEGLGSIYWHMVSKLFLAVEETCT
ncbi:MAG: hypothetical protein KJO04_10785, partial [Bacteroidia bacterium]|nr:hypothetical protein [Bacteroidia bacterium]